MKLSTTAADLTHATASAAPAASSCAGHAQQLGGVSPSTQPDGGEGLAKTQGLPSRGGVQKKRKANVRVDGQEPGIRRERRTSGQRTAKSNIHQGCEAYDSLVEPCPPQEAPATVCCPVWTKRSE